MNRVAATLACLLAFALPASASTFRWASQGDIATQDPHAQDEGFTKANNALVYERLVSRRKDMSVGPGLATAWKRTAPNQWVFTLRRGVKFHDGSAFTADDVVFSFERAGKSRQFRAYAGPSGTVRKVDDFTVEFTAPQPNPLQVLYIGEVPIMSRAWSEKNGVVVAQDFAAKEMTFASRKAMGTGPFRLVASEPGVRTIHARNPDWWGLKEGMMEGNIERIEYRPIANAATRMAALKSGEVDFVLDPSVQDIPRLRDDKELKVWEGDETRIILFAFDQARDELLFSDVKGKNPFKDRRVRQALYQAIDIQALRTQVMRGLATPTAVPTPNPRGEGIPAELDQRYPYDLSAAKKLLAEAGYPNGFGFTLHCPNDRYVNDERICVAVGAMWAKAGLNVKVETMPKAQYFQRTPKKEFSACMQGWGDNNRDAMFTLRPLYHSWEKETGRGDTNYGNFRNAELDALIQKAETEMDAAKRQGFINDAIRSMHREVNVIPLHRQVVPWVSRANVTVTHRSDNWFWPLWASVR